MLRLLYFTATWCAPCRAFGPIIDRTMSQFSDVDFQKVDVDSSKELAQRYSISSVPTLVFERNGMQIARKSGALSQVELTKLIQSYK